MRVLIEEDGEDEEAAVLDVAPTQGCMAALRRGANFDDLLMSVLGAGSLIVRRLCTRFPIWSISSSVLVFFFSMMTRADE